MSVEPFELRFDLGTIKHLGLQMYSTLPPVIGELVSNAWDADATEVDIRIPETRLDDSSEITVIDNGRGMTDTEVRNAYLAVGRDRREAEQRDTTLGGRALMGRKGIGKFSPFGVAREIEVETTHHGETSRFKLDYDELVNKALEQKALLPPLAPTGAVPVGTRVTLRRIVKFRTRRISLGELRRGLARRFMVIGGPDFVVRINGEPLTIEEREIQRLLDKDLDGNPFRWDYEDEEIKAGTGWTVSGWIGALSRTDANADNIQRGISIMARGKMAQEPFVFDATVGQQYALSYLVGELQAEFVDDDEDTIATTRNSLVWDIERNQALKDWGQREVNRIAREWADRRGKDNARRLEQSPLYRDFLQKAGHLRNNRARNVADRLIRGVIGRDILGDDADKTKVIQMCIDFLQFDAFVELAEDLADAGLTDTPRLVELFREWEVVEAREMMRVTEGRIATIRRLQELIDSDALEVPTLHAFLKEFPWVIDPRWTLVADERRFSDLLRERFPDGKLSEQDRRIDFLCVSEGRQLVVVEIKRPGHRASARDLTQVEEYVHYLRDLTAKTTDPAHGYEDVTGLLLVGDVVDKGTVAEKVKSLAAARIFVRRYQDLLAMVERAHAEFLRRYDSLQTAKADEINDTAAA